MSEVVDNSIVANRVIYVESSNCAMFLNSTIVCFYYLKKYIVSINVRYLSYNWTGSSVKKKIIIK